MSKRIYRTMQGREIDMDALATKNETMPSVGNVRMNARGDELGPGGKIIRTREDISAEYYEDNPNATPQTGKTVTQTIPTTSESAKHSQLKITQESKKK